MKWVQVQPKFKEAKHEGVQAHSYIQHCETSIQLQYPLLYTLSRLVWVLCQIPTLQQWVNVQYNKREKCQIFTQNLETIDILVTSLIYLIFYPFIGVVRLNHSHLKPNILFNPYGLVFKLVVLPRGFFIIGTIWLFSTRLIVQFRLSFWLVVLWCDYVTSDLILWSSNAVMVLFLA